MVGLIVQYVLVCAKPPVLVQAELWTAERCVQTVWGFRCRTFSHPLFVYYWLSLYLLSVLLPRQGLRPLLFETGKE